MVKAVISGKGVPAEIEGDVLIGAAVRYDEPERSSIFVVGDINRYSIPAIMAGMVVSILNSHFEGDELCGAYADFHELFLLALSTKKAVAEEGAHE